MYELTRWKRPWCWEWLGAGEGDDRGWHGWMASPTRWTWVWVNSGSWWRTGRPGVLWFMESQRVRHDWVIELSWTDAPITVFLIVLGLFCVGLFLLLCFLPRDVPLAFVVKLAWWYWILFTFACFVSFWFLHHIWTRVLPGGVVLAVGYSLSSV